MHATALVGPVTESPDGRRVRLVQRPVAYSIAEMLRRHAPATQEVVWLAEELGLEQLTIDSRY